MTDLQKDLNWLEAYGQELIERMSANGIEMSTMVALAQVDSAICAVRREMREESRPAVIDLSKLPDTPLAEPGRGHCRKCNGQLDYAGRCLSANCPQRGAHQNADIPAPAKECSFCEWLQEHEVGFPDYMVVHCPECKKQVSTPPAAEPKKRRYIHYPVMDSEPYDEGLMTVDWDKSGPLYKKMMEADASSPAELGETDDTWDKARGEVICKEHGRQKARPPFLGEWLCLICHPKPDFPDPAPAKECEHEWVACTAHYLHSTRLPDGSPDLTVEYCHCLKCNNICPNCVDTKCGCYNPQPPEQECEHKWKLREVDWGVEDWICDLCDKRVPYDPQPPEDK